MFKIVSSYVINNDGTANRSKQRDEITEYESCEMCGNEFTSHYRTVIGHYSDDYFNIEKCNNCGLLFVNPRLNIAFRNFCYKKERHLVDYFLRREKQSRSQAELVLRILSSMDCRNGRLLEVGCGIGIFLNIASERGFHVTGVESNEHTSAYASKRHNVICSDFYSIQLPESFFDIIVIEQTLEHLAEPLKALLKARKLLKTRGFLYIGIPSVDWLSIIIADMTSKIKRLHSFWSPEDHLYYFNSLTVKKYLKRAGFEDVDISGVRLRWKIKKFLGLSFGRFLARKK